MSDLNFSLSGQNENPTKFVAKTRQFTLTIDEPEGLGGTNEAPNPVEFLLAAYAGCLNVMGHIIAKELDFKLNSLKIELDGDLNPSKVFGQPTADRAGYKEIRVNIIPDADADQETLDKWLEAIENRCPVNDNLINPTPVKIALKPIKVLAA
ncbi:MAG: OsmC family protein [Draconibacterium sp.]|nr:OsmC family protein [Draconibacterium sp.]